MTKTNVIYFANEYTVKFGLSLYSDTHTCVSEASKQFVILTNKLMQHFVQIYSTQAIVLALELRYMIYLIKWRNQVKVLLQLAGVTSSHICLHMYIYKKDRNTLVVHINDGNATNTSFCQYRLNFKLSLNFIPTKTQIKLGLWFKRRG